MLWFLGFVWFWPLVTRLHFLFSRPSGALVSNVQEHISAQRALEYFYLIDTHILMGMSQVSFHSLKHHFLFIDWLILEREKERGEGERDEFIFPLIYAFIGWFLHVDPDPGLNPQLWYQNNILTSWASWPRVKDPFLTWTGLFQSFTCHCLKRLVKFDGVFNII